MSKLRPRLGQSVKDIVVRKSSNRNSELQFLASQFDVVKIKLTQFIEALKEQYKVFLQMSKTRLSVSLLLLRFQITSCGAPFRSIQTDG